MAKRLLILAYVLAVLAISSMVRAEVIPPPVLTPFSTGHALIRDVVLASETGILNVHGVLPNPCHSKPEIITSDIGPSENTITLDVTTTVPAQACVEMLGKEFDISFDLKDLPLKAGQVYEIRFQNSDQTIKYNALKPFEGLEYYKLNKKSFRGTLVGSSTTSFVLQSGSSVVRVFSPDLDLEKYKNVAVSMVGYPVDLANLNGGPDSLAQSSQAETVIVPVSVSRVAQ